MPTGLCLGQGADLERGQRFMRPPVDLLAVDRRVVRLAWQTANDADQRRITRTSVPAGHARSDPLFRVELRHRHDRSGKRLEDRVGSEVFRDAMPRVGIGPGASHHSGVNPIFSIFSIIFCNEYGKTLIYSRGTPGFSM